MQCPSCKEPIDNDSRYCDQCGEQIKVCPVCGKPGKGKFCTQDQNELVPAGTVPAGSAVKPAAPAAQQSPPVQSAPPAQQAPIAAAPPQFAAATGDTVQFSGAGITFEAKDGDIIGRKAGPFTGIFAAQQFVSGTHCKVIKLPAGWHIQDLGSTNGTFVQGNKLAPNAPYPLASGSAVKIASLDFTVMFDDGGGTSRI
jgi:predicted component of type VI protein secretion system